MELYCEYVRAPYLHKGVAETLWCTWSAFWRLKTGAACALPLAHLKFEELLYDFEGVMTRRLRVTRDTVVPARVKV